MKKTKYFTTLISWNKSIEGCDGIINERDEFINENNISKIDSEDLRVDFCGINRVVCFLRLT